MHVSTKTGAYQMPKAEQPTRKWIVYATQLLAFPLLISVRLIIVRNKLKRHPKLYDSVHRGNKNFVIYANHQSKLDPFIICAALPFRVLISLLPFRFFVENSYFKGQGSKLFLGMFGGFRAHFHPTKPYGLDHAKMSLNSSQSVVIFPQGRRTREKTAKPGVAMLAVEPNTALIPIKIDWKHRFHCEVSIGKAFEVIEFSSADSLMDKVYKLS